MRITTTLLSAALFALPACVDDELADDSLDPADAPGEAIRLDDRPAPLGTLDHGRAWPKDTLKVCFMPSTAPFFQLAGNLEHEIGIRWGAVGRIKFLGWVSCAAMPDADIRIGHDPAINGFSKIGTDALTVPADQPTMTINFTGPVGQACFDDEETQPTPTAPTRQCNGSVIGPPADLEVWVTSVALHEFGHALGLRHEHVHPDSTCHPLGSAETLDAPGHDGEPIGPYDGASVMSYCALDGYHSERNLANVKLANGDIRALHTLYPGVVALFADPQLRTGMAPAPTLVSLGYHTTATLPALTQLSSLVVPPGFTVRACNATGGCESFSDTRRTLSATLDNRTQNLLVTASTVVYDDVGYRGGAQAVQLGGYEASAGQLAGVGGDNRVSSVQVPPASQAVLCSGAGGTGACVTHVGGVFGTTSYRLGFMDDQTSSVRTTHRVVSYSDVYRGQSWSLGIGVYDATSSPWVADIHSLTVPTLRVKACNAVTCTPTGCAPAGVCTTVETSANLSSFVGANGPLRYLRVSSVPIVSR